MFKGKKEEAPKGGKEALPDDILSQPGLVAVVRRGLESERENRFKNRLILCLVVALVISLGALFRASGVEPQIRLLGETSDGRIRPLPLLSDPIYNTGEILGWAERCVQKIYRLSFVDWKTTVQNETECLSDKARADFVNSLRTMGLLDNLTAEHQGTLYAVPEQSTLRNARLTPGGYNEWIVDVPYRVVLDGRRKGQIDVVMTMRIRRVSLTWREAGIWVESYQVSPKRT